MKRLGFVILSLGYFVFVQAVIAQWGPVKRITWTSGSSEAPAIAVDPFGHPHVVWREFLPAEGEEVYYKKSTDGGATWTPAKRLTWSLAVSGSPAIAADSSGNPHVAWSRSLSSGNTEIYYRKSTDGGTNWTAAKRLTWTSPLSSSPALAVDSAGNLHVVWSESVLDGGFWKSEIYCKKSSDGGAAWTTGQRLTWTADFSSFPAVTLDSSGNPHVVWQDFWPGNWEVFHKRGADGGTTWTANKRLTWTPGHSTCPRAIVDAIGNLSVVWSEDVSEDFNSEIYYKKSPDGGTAWTANKRLTWTPSISLYPGVAADPAGNVYVVWEEDLDHTEIYYKKSTNGGSVWSRTWNISWTSGDSYEPNVALDSSGHLHMVWYDATPGNFEIYYRKRE